MRAHRSRAVTGGALLTAVATLSALALGPATPAAADPNNNNSAKLRKAVTLDGVRRHQAALQSIATASGGIRYAGLVGHDRSVAYVMDQLRRAGYSPTTQEFSYESFREVTPATFAQTAPSAVSYTKGTDFQTMSYSGSGSVTAPVTKLATLGGSATGCSPADFAGFTPGTIALISRGGCTFRIKVTNAEAAGAVGTVVYNNIDGLLNGTLGSTDGLSAKPAIGTTKALGEQLLATSGLQLRLPPARRRPADHPQRARRAARASPGTATS